MPLTARLRPTLAALAAVLAAALTLSAPCLAGPGLRVAVKVDERVDDKPAEPGGARAALVERLLADGHTVVEEGDLLLTGQVDLKAQQLPYGIQGVEAWAASVELRLQQVDTGRVLWNGRRTGKGAMAAAALSAKLAGALLDEATPHLRSGSSGDVVELSVAGLADAGAADELATLLGRAPGVTGATVRAVTADRTRIDLSGPGLTPAALAAALKAAGLVVRRRSAHAVEAARDAVAAAHRTVSVRPFDDRTGRAGLAWIASVGPAVLATELANSRHLSPLPPDEGGGAPELTLHVALELAGGKLRLTGRAAGAGGGDVATAQTFGAEEDAVDLVRELAWRLDEAVFRKLAPSGSLAQYRNPLQAPGAGAAAGAGARIELASVAVEPVFPAQLGHYAEHPVGEVVVASTGGRAAAAVRLAVRVGDLTGEAQVFDAGTLAPGARATLPLKLVFDRDRLLESTQRRPVRVTITASARDGDGEVGDALTRPTVLHDRNALSWREPESVAAFVTHRDPLVRHLVRAVLDAAPPASKALPRGVHVAVALFDALAALGLRYRPDPVAAYGAQAVDTVLFPRETLAERVGDCDDLSVLYAALTTAAGVGARLVLTPGHIFVAVDSGVPTARADALGGPSRTLGIEGRAWIPVEVTRVGEGDFRAAWAAGVAEIGRYRDDRDRVAYVDLGRAWATFPPFPIAGPGEPPRLPKTLRGLVDADLAGLTGSQGDGDGEALAIVPAAADRPGDGDPASLLRAGTAAGRRGDWPRALEALEAAAKAPGLRGRALNNIGNVHTLTGRLARALEAYREAAGDRSIAAAVQTNMGVAWYQKGDGDKARKALKRAGTAEARRLMKALGLAGAAKRRRGKARPKAAAPAGTVGGADASLDWGMRAGSERVEPAAVLIWTAP